jgi:hypothetical protein
MLQFDDTEHMNDADPALMKACAMEITRYQCNKKDNKFEDIVECLREKFNELSQCESLRGQRAIKRLQLQIARP